MAKRKWRQLPGYLSYKISYEGKVKDLTTKTILKPKRNSKGEDVYTLTSDFTCDGLLTINIPAHVLVASLFLDRPEDPSAKIYHKDGNFRNNHMDNLQWVVEDPHLMCIKFYSRPSTYPVTAFWEKDNVLCIHSKKALTDDDRKKILSIYTNQDTSGHKPYVCT